MVMTLLRMPSTSVQGAGTVRASRMSDLQPVVWLLTGMPGSGKTTFAKALVRVGVVRLSVDDQMTARHGRIGKDHAEHEHLALHDA
ncbi:AAA family ATPase [Streptomyces sp. NBC_01022]|uniref:AAA family ATPase n=1 Tax=Streptomyces sp. NBC_01022 TaxID=2903723 RepID=UPI002DD844B5|nr:AAA family ATPase [Streptomyces sp. NBC_01022]WRZ83179.1 ATP-binding protein [Streptomyces sp. NBC_01022]